MRTFFLIEGVFLCESKNPYNILSLASVVVMSSIHFDLLSAKLSDSLFINYLTGDKSSKIAVRS